MKKQKLPLNFGLVVLLVGSCLNAIPLRSYAGEVPALGSSIDSSTSSGDTFSPSVEPSTVISPGIDATVEVNGQINLQPNVQQSLNQKASELSKKISCDDSVGISDCLENPQGTIFLVVQRTPAVEAAIAQLQTSLSNAGVKEQFVSRLLKNLTGLFQAAGVPVSRTKNLMLAQTQEVKVDINQLNNAIATYNEIVRQSDLQTLRKLSRNAEFMEINRILKELRASLKVG